MDDQLLVEKYMAARTDRSLVVLEGFHALKHAVRFGAELLDVRCTDTQGLARLAIELAADVYRPVLDAAAEVPPEVFKRLSPSSIPTDTIGLAKRPEVSPKAMLDNPAPAPVVLLERPRNLGNIGASIRAAAAAGAGGVVTTGEHDPWSPGALAGGAGLQYALPVVQVSTIPESGRPLVAFDPDGEPLHLADVPPRSILAFGSERAGLSREARARADLCVSIPMAQEVSSLNLATSVAVALYTLKFRHGAEWSSG